MELRYGRVEDVRKLEPIKPEPEACEACWSEHNARHGQQPGEDDWFPYKWEEDEVPKFNPDCPICVANYEMAVAQYEAQHSAWTERRNKQATDGGRA